ncbi:MAG: cytochrome c maturation protein CcmE [Actinomycetota bacterium]
MASPRARFAVTAALVAACVLGLIVWATSGSTAYYRTPAELLAAPVDQERVRVAGKVVEGSVSHRGTITAFAVSDGKAELPVSTDALLPDTFGPGVEVVAEGAMTTRGVFAASTVLAKCPSKFKAKV